MSAPLHSRYTRYWEREAKKFHPRIADILRSFKKPARIYSFSENASKEAGGFSAAPPQELLKAVSNIRDPGGDLWLEFDWRAAVSGMQEAGIPVAPCGDEHPVRMAFLVTFKPAVMGRADISGVLIAGMNFTFYPNKANVLSPTVTFLGDDAHAMIDGNEDFLNYFAKMAKYPFEACAMGPGYLSMFNKPKNKADLVKLLLAGSIAILPFVKQKFRSLANDTNMFGDMNGNARVMLAVLATALLARPKDYVRDLNLPPKKTDPRERSGTEVIEIDLFIRPKMKVGHTIIRAVNAAERAKKRRHEVLGHWAYRTRPDGSDPTRCRGGGEHEWEDIEGTKSQVCITCSQKRWFRDKHERGDESQGRAPQKIYNVRA